MADTSNQNTDGPTPTPTPNPPSLPKDEEKLDREPLKPSTDSNTLSVKVRSNVGDNEVIYRIKYTTILDKVMRSFSQKMGVRYGTFRFIFDGDRLNPNDTPQKLEMDDLDVIDAFVRQQGGM